MAQHVGPASASELIEHFLGRHPQHRSARDPQAAVAAAEAAGLTLVDLRTARCRMEFFDIGAVVYILRKCVWWVPDFTVERYLAQLRGLDATLLITSMQAGVPVHVVAERLGHADPAITLRAYAHVLRRAASGVAAVFADAVDNDVEDSEDDDAVAR